MIARLPNSPLYPLMVGLVFQAHCLAEDEHRGLRD